MKASQRRAFNQGLKTFGLAASATLVALALRLAASPWLFERATFMPFFWAILLVGWLGGLWPGLLTTIMSSLVGAYVLLPPSYSFWVESTSDQLQLALFTTTALAICWACGSMHALTQILESKKLRLEQEIVDISEHKALLEGEERMKLATEATGVGLWEWNLITNRIRWDDHLFRIYQVAPTDNGFVPYKTWSDAVAPEDLPKTEEILQDTIRRRGQSRREFRIRRPGEQEYRYIQAVETIRTNAEGQAEWVIGTNLDITERKLAEEELTRLNESLERQVAERTMALSDREQRLRAILNTAADTIITIDHQGTIRSANPTTEAMFGYSQEELLGKNVSMLLPKPYFDEHDSHLNHPLQTDNAYINTNGREILGKRKDGSIFPAELAVSRVELFNEFTGIIRDITHRKQLQKQVLKIAEEEQRRIGQELHDGTGQELTGLALVAGTVAKLLEELPYQADGEDPSWRLDEAALLQLRHAANRLSQGLSQANRHVQQLSHGILPVQVEPEGLRSALEQLASTTDTLQNITCSFDCPQIIAVANNTVATHLYRIAQEAVNNAMRHSKATQIRISLLYVKNDIILEVSDNGIGFDPSSICDEAVGIPRGFGLQIMNYRASMIGAAFQITRRDDQGMLVRCAVPREISIESQNFDRG